MASEIIYQGCSFGISVTDLPAGVSYVAALYSESTNQAFRVSATDNGVAKEFVWNGATTKTMPIGVYRLEIYAGTLTGATTDLIVVQCNYAEVRSSNFMANNLPT